MLSKLLLREFLLEACYHANEELTEETSWIYEKYVSLMMETQTECEYAENSPQYMQDTMIMLTCVSARMFRCPSELRLKDLEIAYSRAGRGLDVSNSPFESTLDLSSQKEPVDKGVEEYIEVEPLKEEPRAQSIVVKEEEPSPDVDSTTLKENIHLTCHRRNKFLEPTNWGPHRNDLKKVRRSSLDLKKKQLAKAVPKLPRNTDFWSKNLKTYTDLVTHPEDILSFAYDQSNIPGIGISNGERKLILKSFFLNACEWKPDAKIRRFIVEMHKPWFLGDQ